ncbi:phosphoglycerate mutase [Holotrichia oblita]|uniref:Phosphoglycerate mutase n=1 Tax=Holotrichia oblita TaxID=644536 RepID=A0ACB9TR67_HOLOL|nr:phosphoglycerate mutase [Holotrichia oblita]
MKIKKLALVRHGESIWNRENRFTGWTDVDLTAEGVEESYRAGDMLREEGLTFDMAFTSYLKRAIKSLDCILDRMNLDWIPVEKSWRLNEKHYGALQGLNKGETADRYGGELVQLWRRSYNTPPEPLTEDDPRNPRFDIRYRDVPPDDLPLSESLKDTINRLMPYWNDTIFPSLSERDNILIVAHGNSLRGIVKHLKNISDDDIAGLNLPTAIPYIFEFDSDLKVVNDYFLGNPEEIEKMMKETASVR